MIFDPTGHPRGVTLIRIPRAGAATGVTNDLQLSDIVPLFGTGKADPRQWKPDGVMGSQTTWSSEVAESPLADGSTAANHVRKNPIRFSFDAIITDTPLMPFTPLVGNGPLGGLASVRRADAILASLLDIWASRSFVAMVSPTLVLSTALVTQVDHTRSPEDGSSYLLNITIQEIRTYAIRQIASIDDAAAQLGGARTTSAGGIVFSG